MSCDFNNVIQTVHNIVQGINSWFSSSFHETWPFLNHLKWLPGKAFRFYSFSNEALVKLFHHYAQNCTASAQSAKSTSLLFLLFSNTSITLKTSILKPNLSWLLYCPKDTDETHLALTSWILMQASPSKTYVWELGSFSIISLEKR